MIVIVDNVTGKTEEDGGEVIGKTAKGLDIKNLLRCSGFQIFLLREESSLIDNYSTAL